MARNINRSIVVVNEFTIHGSRGNSPGQYVSEYMARDNASENLTPTMARTEYVEKLREKMEKTFRKQSEIKTGPDSNLSDYVTRYMARETATEILYLDGSTKTHELNDSFDKIQGMSGIAFSKDSLSMSHKEVKEKSKMIQDQYESGKPVLKTVISFDTEYLKEMGVLPKDLIVKKRGDLYGKSDQAKLRLAIQHGLRNIEHNFSNLDYIGVIQVDTKHIHCHLAMVDKGQGKNFTKDGEQKGMLSEKMKMSIKRGIDNSLDQNSLIKPLSIQMEGERRNTLAFIKKFTNQIMEERGIPQFLLACLPKDDKSLWKAEINTDGGPDNMMTVRKGKTQKKISGNMKKANEIVRSYVVDLLNRPDSGFIDTMRIKHDYLMARMNRGEFDGYETYTTRIVGGKKKSILTKLSPEEAVRAEEEKFREEVITKGMNAVYGILKTIDDRTVKLHTPFLDAMSMPYDEMANYVKEDKMIEFGFRLRSYSNRLSYHKENYRKINDVIHQYEDGNQAEYNPDSKVVYDFLKVEQEYNHSLMCKYQTFLHFYHVRDEYKDEYEDLMDLRHISYGRHAMSNDKNLKKIKDLDKMEKEGEAIYGLKGASLMVSNPSLFQQQMALEDQNYARGLRNFREHLAEYGLLYDDVKDDIHEGLQYKFDDVKAYDFHHMSYDFVQDFRIATVNVDNFVRMSNMRYNTYLKAARYLENTGQPHALDGIINVDDILAAKQLADEYRREGNTYHTKFDESVKIRQNTATIRLDHEIYDELSDRNIMKSLRDIMTEPDEAAPVIEVDEPDDNNPEK